MNKRVANRIDRIQDPVIPIVGRLIADHPGTISLGQGIVHYSPPLEFRRALANPPEQVHRYADVCGNVELLNLIRNKVASENQIDCGESTIVYTAGSNMGFLNAVFAVADVDDEIILMSPYYFNHEMAIDLAGCKPVIVPTTSDYQLDLPAIRQAITERTRAIVTVSPNNPTGVVYPQAVLTEVNALCAEQGIYHISDEAYEYFVYDGKPHFSPASLPGSQQHTISLFTMSKAYGMAGWRAGYMIAPQDLLMPIKKIQDTNLVCPPIISQSVAGAVLEVGADYCKPKIEEFGRVREAVLRELSDIPGCRIPVPQGAFYMLLQLDTDQEDMALVKALVKDFGVATLPGNTFGVRDGCALRISYGALESKTVIEGIGRLKRGLQSLL